MHKDLKVVKEENERLKEKIEVLEAIVDRVDKRVAQMENKTEKVKEGLAGMEKEVASGLEKAKEEVKKNVKEEMKEIEGKSSNIVLYGLEESKEADKTKRDEEEKEKVKELAEVLKVEVKGDVVIKWRCGKRSEDATSKPRPMIVRVSDDETRENIFQNARMLANLREWKGVFVSPDLTYAQREEGKKEERKLKEEAEAKTEAAKEAGKEEEWIVVGQRGRRRVVMSDGRRGRREAV